MSDVKPWHRRRDLHESGAAYHAFAHFRDLDVRVRSLDRAYTVCQTICPRDKNRLTPPPTPAPEKAPEKLPEPLKEATRNWKDWRRRFLWDARIAEYDAHLEEEERVEAKAAIKKMRETHANIASFVMAKVVERLRGIGASDISVGQLPKFLREAAQLERISRGQPTEIVRTDRTMPDLSGLTEAEIDQLTALLEKAGATTRE